MKAEALAPNRSISFFRILGLSAVCSANLMAAPVDSEILILVDGQTFSGASFDFLLDGVAKAFEQQSFIDSVAEGAYGSIAASVMVFNAAGTTTAIPWVELSNVNDLQDFATSVRGITTPFSFGTIGYADAIASGAASIAGSTAEGTIRQMTIIEDLGFGLATFDTSGEIQTARDTALAGGVDVINAVVYNAGGRQDGVVQDYYDEFVVGGTPGGTAGVVEGSIFGEPTGTVADDVDGAITVAVTQPTIDSNNLSRVPEPSVALLGGLSGLFLLGRRRRREA